MGANITNKYVISLYASSCKSLQKNLSAVKNIKKKLNKINKFKSKNESRLG